KKIKKERYIFSKINIIQKNDLNTAIDYNENLELKTLEDDVISMKIYTRYSFQNIILFDIYKMIIKFRKLYFDLKFTYIKYRESKDHLRIRFYVRKEDKYKILEKIVNSINEILHIDFFEIVPFYQEKLKYNIDSYELYKEYIKIESELIVNILEKQSKEKKYILYFIIIRTTEIFNMQNEYEYVVSNLLRFKNIREKTNRDKKVIISKIKELKDNTLKGVELEKLYVDWEQSLYNYVYSLNDISYSKKYDILRNIIHIQINRFYGIDRNLEEEILEVVFILLKFIINKQGE
ncbi:thiopeptide-type bacteriocin biosynthesis protein, partial [Streptobacillus moniliformis]|uniref:thiopeptide-type bacteriocin biosynthesis protein n=4 Tax=Streptobacillus moniliformis TaxID=34105 RepID=UPI000AAF638C